MTEQETKRKPGRQPKLYQYDGGVYTAAELAKRHGLTERRARWLLQEGKPLQPRRPPMRIESGGETHTVREWADILGTTVSTVHRMRKAGRPLRKEEADAIAPVPPATLCWSCKNTCAGKCPWFTNFAPVPGWDAEPTIIKNVYSQIESYFVRSCPMYESEQDDKAGDKKVHTDCAFYKDDGQKRCTALSELECRRGECAFYTTREEARIQRFRSYKRRMELGMAPTETDYRDGFVKQHMPGDK